jgi:hypothetical protein
MTETVEGQLPLANSPSSALALTLSQPWALTWAVQGLQPLALGCTWHLTLDPVTPSPRHERCMSGESTACTACAAAPQQLVPHPNSRF